MYGNRRVLDMKDSYSTDCDCWLAIENEDVNVRENNKTKGNDKSLGDKFISVNW